ncbi:copper homeostasis protein CutC [Clostridia bacterium]|nr:copper homeostasis protein CutC [Clostridia bacterium]
MLLEICCGSYYDALQAESGGAKRIELNCGLHLGGLTPSTASLTLVKERCQVKVIAMLRPRGGGFHYSNEDFELMLRECQELLRHDADGIAFGCLKKDGNLDWERNAKLISNIHEYGKEAVFHRAFDCSSNPEKTMESLIALGIDRVLTSGLKAKAIEGKALLKRLQETYGKDIQILAGSGINASNAKQLMEETGIQQVHSSCKDWLCDPTTSANGVSYAFATAPYESCYDVVSATSVRQLLNAMD